MIRIKRFLALFGLIALVILARPMLYGVDAYFYASIACGFNQAASHESILAHAFDAFPCNFDLMKLVLVVLAGIDFLLLWKIGGLFDQRDPENYALAFLLNVLLFQSLFDFEGNAFGMPFVLASLFFFVKFLQSRDWKQLAIAGSIASIGMIAWLNIAVWIVALALALVWTIPLAIGALWFKGLQLWQSISWTESEHGIPFEGFLLQCLFFAIGYLEITPIAWLPLLWLTGLAILSTKYSLWLGLLLCVGLCMYAKKKALFNWNKRVRDMVFWIPFAMTIPFLFLAPSADNLRFAQHVVQVADGQPINSHFDFRHYLTVFGGKASFDYEPAFMKDPDHLAPGIYVWDTNLNCTVLDKTNFMLIKDFQLYQC